MPILICGLGSIGRRHLRNLRALGRDDVVLFRTGKSTLPDDELEGLPVESDLCRALERWRPQAAVISNPTALHMEVAIPIAEAGCHILIEKPVSHSMDGIDDLREALGRGGGQVLVGYQFRFHPGLGAVRQLLENETIGRPISAHAHWGEYLPDWHPWEDYRHSYSARSDLGGGVVFTLSHPFDYLRWLLGEVEAVMAETSRTGCLELQVEDSAEIILTIKKGALAHVHLDYNQRPARHWLEIIGSQGTIRWDNDDGVTRWWSANEGQWHEIAPHEDFERNVLFINEMRHFLEVVDGAASSTCTLDDGVRALEIALATHMSSASGRRVLLPAMDT